MSTVRTPLKYLWVAFFEDGNIIIQPEDDKYSKHDNKAEHNPSAFRDILDHQKESKLMNFLLLHDDDTEQISLDLSNGEFSLGGFPFFLGDEGEVERKLIFYRNVEQKFIDGEAQDPEIVSYSVGYEYKDEKGKVQKKVITVDGRL